MRLDKLTFTQMRVQIKGGYNCNNFSKWCGFNLRAGTNNEFTVIRTLCRHPVVSEKISTLLSTVPWNAFVAHLSDSKSFKLVILWKSFRLFYKMKWHIAFIDWGELPCHQSCKFVLLCTRLQFTSLLVKTCKNNHWPWL